MIFILNNQKYAAATAVEIVRAIEKDARDYSPAGGSVRDFLSWSLAQFADRIHFRDLENSTHVSDETLAFSYLCLLDEYYIGLLAETKN